MDKSSVHPGKRTDGCVPLESKPTERKRKRMQDSFLEVKGFGVKQTLHSTLRNGHKKCRKKEVTATSGMGAHHDDECFAAGQLPVGHAMNNTCSAQQHNRKSQKKELLALSKKYATAALTKKKSIDGCVISSRELAFNGPTTLKVQRRKVVEKNELVGKSYLKEGDIASLSKQTPCGTKTPNKACKIQVGTLSLVHGKLKAARFRHLNEELYTKSGEEALKMFRNDPEAFQTYHEGFQLQVSRWPVNPLDVIIQHLSCLPCNSSVADFGCGEGRLAESLQNRTVHSFDLVASKPFITACNIAKVPLKNKTVDSAVFCLSLMGTQLSKYLIEANRVLRKGGSLHVAEVLSRFDNVAEFVKLVEHLGFQLQTKELLGKMFLLFVFKKARDIGCHSVPFISLKPCLYKRR